MEIINLNPAVTHVSDEMIHEITAIYDAARAFMRRSGNTRQWSGSYPSAESLRQDMAEGNSYAVCVNRKPVATFYFKTAEDPTYAKIYDGAWLNDAPYGVIHRVASDGTHKGVMKLILDFCLTKIDNIRIDTHRDNAVMRNALISYGFSYCGIIHLANGDERLAYHMAK